VGTETKRACTVVCIFFFIIFLVVQSQCDLGHIFPLKVKQRKDVKKKAMWNVQCIEEWRTSFMTSPPASPVQWLENKSKKKSVIGFHNHNFMFLKRKVCGIVLSFDGKGFFS